MARQSGSIYYPPLIVTQLTLLTYEAYIYNPRQIQDFKKGECSAQGALARIHYW